MTTTQQAQGLIARMCILWPGWQPPADLTDPTQAELLYSDWSNVLDGPSISDLHAALDQRATSGAEWPPRPGELAADARVIAGHRARQRTALPAGAGYEPLTSDAATSVIDDQRAKNRSRSTNDILRGLLRNDGAAFPRQILTNPDNDLPPQSRHTHPGRPGAHANPTGR